VKDLLNILQVFFPILSKGEDVIHIYHEKGIGEGPQYIIHQSHESYWTIFQTKGHDYPFEKIFFGLESNLPYISIFYWELVVAILPVNVTEGLASLELVKKFLNSGNWVPVPDCDFV